MLQLVKLMVDSYSSLNKYGVWVKHNLLRTRLNCWEWL